MTDPIADLLTRIRNAYLARQEETLVPHSNLKQQLADILKTNGYLEKTEIVKEQSSKFIKLTLKYRGKYGTVSGIDRVSKPGRRVYVRFADIKPVLSGTGLTIISTSKGLMTGHDARKQKLGGELLCKVW